MVGVRAPLGIARGPVMGWVAAGRLGLLTTGVAQLAGAREQKHQHPERKPQPGQPAGTIAVSACSRGAHALP